MKTSNLFTLNKSDLLKGLFVAFITALLTSLLQVMQSGKMPTMADLKVMGVTSLTAALAYFVKNFLTNSEGDVAVKEPK